MLPPVQAGERRSILFMPDLGGHRPTAPYQASELMRHLERRAAMDPNDNHPSRATIVATHAVGDEFTVIYRQSRSPQLFGRCGNVGDLFVLFEPPQTPSQLAAILLQAMSEPSGAGQAGPHHSARGSVADPTRIEWLIT